AASSGGTAAAGGAGDRVPDWRAALPGLWEAHPSRPAGRGAPAAVRCAPDGGGGSLEWPVSLESAGSAAATAGPVGGAVVPGRSGAPGAGPECRPGTRGGGSPVRGPRGG